MGLCYKQIAENLNISLGTACNICRLFKDTRSVDAHSAEHHRLLADHQKLWVMGLVLDNCSFQLKEICQKSTIRSEYKFHHQQCSNLFTGMALLGRRSWQRLSDC